MSTPATFGFRDLPFMGVIHVNNEAMRAGWRMGDPEWSNLGQGQPEVGDIEGAPPRIRSLDIDPADHAYGPVEGLPEYRGAVAAHYNRLYRRGMASQYTAENVCIAPGGRAALTRLAAAMDRVRMGYFTPDYTAYEDMLTTFATIEPVHIELAAAQGFRASPDDLARRIERDRLGAVLISNPCNPTGVVVAGDELRAWVETSRRTRCTLLMDEFYSHFVYHADGPSQTGRGISAAEFVGDVNEDPVVIIDGLTKCFRYPGWRSGWVVGPKAVIRAMTAAGSFLDGGPSRPMQRLGIQALKPERADQETNAVRSVFAAKHRPFNMLRGGVRLPGGRACPFGRQAAPSISGASLGSARVDQHGREVHACWLGASAHRSRRVLRCQPGQAALALAARFVRAIQFRPAAQQPRGRPVAAGRDDQGREVIVSNRRTTTRGTRRCRRRRFRRR